MPRPRQASNHSRAVPLAAVFGVIALIAATFCWSVFAVDDPDIHPFAGGEWRTRVDLSTATSNPCAELSEVCVEWCELAPSGEATPTGRLCCKAKSTFDPHDPTCSKPIAD